MKLNQLGQGLRQWHAILFLSLTLAACSPGGGKPDLSERDVDQASALLRSNVMCELLVNYRIGSVRLLARDGEYHHKLGNVIAGAISFEIDQFRSDVDSAFSEDMNDILSSKHGDKYEEIMERDFRALQNILKEDFGFSYPDCDMVISMSEAFIQHKGLVD